MKKKGFTLIELLVVISIISLLTSVAFASFSSARAKARDAKRLLDFDQFKTALELYYNTYNKYPCGDYGDLPGVTTDSSLSDPFLDGIGTSTVPECTGSPTYGIYTGGFYPISQPKDPINNFTGLSHPNNYAYGYDVSTDRLKYILYGRLEANDEKMQNDGGECNLLYETGVAIGDMQPQLWEFVGEGCY